MVCAAAWFLCGEFHKSCFSKKIHFARSKRVKETYRCEKQVPVFSLKLISGVVKVSDYRDVGLLGCWTIEGDPSTVQSRSAMICNKKMKTYTINTLLRAPLPHRDRVLNFNMYIPFHMLYLKIVNSCLIPCTMSRKLEGQNSFDCQWIQKYSGKLLQNYTKREFIYLL